MCNSGSSVSPALLLLLIATATNPSPNVVVAVCPSCPANVSTAYPNSIARSLQTNTAEVQHIAMPMASPSCDMNSNGIDTFYSAARAQGQGYGHADKVTGHAYETMYGIFLAPLAHLGKSMKLLEIGLGCVANPKVPIGASARIWRRVLPQAELWEAEYDGDCVRSRRQHLDDLGIGVLVGDQGDPLTLRSWINETGGNFNVVIDDGGHKNSQIMTSFELLWPTLKPGGLYFMEDLQVGRWEEETTFRRNRKPPVTKGPYDDTHGKHVMSDVLQDWIEQLLISERHTHLPSSRVEHEDLSPQFAYKRHPIPSDVAFVFCQREACVIGKARNPKLHR